MWEVVGGEATGKLIPVQAVRHCPRGIGTRQQPMG